MIRFRRFTVPSKRHPKITTKTVEHGIYIKQFRPTSFREALRQTLGDHKLLLLLALITIPFGISAQLSWIEFRCIGEPFLGSLKATCRDNLWRMLFGGPLIFGIGILAIAWMRSQEKPISRGQTLFPFFFLLPICYLPFNRTEVVHDHMISLVAVLFSVALIFASRQKIWSYIQTLFKKPAFDIHAVASEQRLKLSLVGELRAEERRWIFDSLLRVIMDAAAAPREVEIDIQNLKNVNSDSAFIFYLLLGLAEYAKAHVQLSGSAENMHLIAKYMKQAHTRFI